MWDFEYVFYVYLYNINKNIFLIINFFSLVLLWFEYKYFFIEKKRIKICDVEK